MRWYHPISGDHGSFNHQLQGIAEKLWQPLPHELNQIGTLPVFSSSGKIIPETPNELVENFSLVTQRKFPFKIKETRFCTVTANRKLKVIN